MTSNRNDVYARGQFLNPFAAAFTPQLNMFPDLRNTGGVLSPWAETFIPLSEKRLKGFEKSLITPVTLLNPNANIFIPRETLGSLSEHDDGVDSHVPSDSLTPTRWADLSILVK